MVNYFFFWRIISLQKFAVCFFFKAFLLIGNSPDVHGEGVNCVNAISLWWSTMQQAIMILWVCFYWDGKVLKMYVEWKHMFYSSLCSVRSFIYGHTSFYCTLVYCALQILQYWTNSRYVQPWVEQVYQRYFSSSILSLCVSVSQVGDSSDISSFWLFFIFVVVISELWCYRCKKTDLLKPQMIVNIYLTIKYFLFFFFGHIRQVGS